MATRKYKPSSAGRRHMMVADFSEITKSKPEKALTEAHKRSGGRNNTGRITVFQRSGAKPSSPSAAAWSVIWPVSWPPPF